MHPAHEIPTKAEELDRKSMTELSRIVHLYETHQITHREMNLMLDTLWSCVSGLVSEEWREMIEAARRVANTQAPWNLVMMRPAAKPGGLGLFVLAKRGQEEIDMSIYAGDGKLMQKSHLPFTDREVPSVATSENFERLQKSLTDKGYQTT